jgi:hypothetical protein
VADCGSVAKGNIALNEGKCAGNGEGAEYAGETSRKRKRRFFLVHHPSLTLPARNANNSAFAKSVRSVR